MKRKCGISFIEIIYHDDVMVHLGTRAGNFIITCQAARRFVLTMSFHLCCEQSELTLTRGCNHTPTA